MASSSSPALVEPWRVPSNHPLPLEIILYIVHLDFKFDFELKITSPTTIVPSNLFHFADVNLNLLLANKDLQKEALTTFFRDNRFVIAMDHYQHRMSRQLQDMGVGVTTYNSAQQKLFKRVPDGVGALSEPYSRHIKVLVLLTDSMDIDALRWLCVTSGLARLKSAFVNLEKVVIRMEMVKKWNEKMVPLFPGNLGEVRPTEDEDGKPIELEPRLQFILPVPGMLEICSEGEPEVDCVRQLWRETVAILANWQPTVVVEEKVWPGVSLGDSKTLRRHLERMFSGRSWRTESD